MVYAFNTYNSLPVITVITIKSGAIHWSVGTSDDPWSILPRVDFLQHYEVPDSFEFYTHEHIHAVYTHSHL